VPASRKDSNISEVALYRILRCLETLPEKTRQSLEQILADPMIPLTFVPRGSIGLGLRIPYVRKP
jgi:hypothetical protein